MPTPKRSLRQTLLLIAGLGLVLFKLPAYGADASQIDAFLAERQALVAEGKVDIDEMSKAIRAAVADSEKLDHDGKDQEALDRLLQLQKYAPLPEIPSFDTQMLASWLYLKTGDKASADQYRARADAMRALLQSHIGGGTTPDDPLHAIMISDAIEWTRMQLARVSDMKIYPYQGHDLYDLTYAGPTTGNQPAHFYVLLDPRVQARMNQALSAFTPLPLDKLKPDLRASVEHAKASRDQFIADTSFSYLALMNKVNASIRKAQQLSVKGDYSQALAALNEIETIRPIEDVPFSPLIELDSFLNGRLGNTQKQIELRSFLFGINQVIAHSGDGLTQETAVQVIAVGEEYRWLQDKHLSLQLQKLVNVPPRAYDVMSTKSPTGEQKDYYFDVTQIMGRSATEISAAQAGH